MNQLKKKDFKVEKQYKQHSDCKVTEEYIANKLYHISNL